MGRDQRGQIVIIAFTFSLVGMPRRGFAVMNETTECLVDFEGVSDTYKSGGTIQCTDCDPSCDADGVNTANGSCTFNLQVCVNEAGGACAAAPLKKVRVTGACGAVALAPTPSGTAPSCRSAALKVNLKKHGHRAGKCKVVATAISSDRPKKVDKDVLMLVCSPQTGACPTTTTTTTTVTTTTTTLRCGNGTVDAGEQCDPPGTSCPTAGACDDNCQCAAAVCERIAAGHPITGQYQTATLPSSDPIAAKICTTNSPDGTQRFGACTVDSACGTPVVTGACAQTPWVDAGGVTQPTGRSTMTFSV